MSRPTVLALAASLACGCSLISFSRPLSMHEQALESEVGGFYTDLQSAFAAGNPEALALLYSPSITHPMTQDQIRAWASGFFSRNRQARLRLEHVEFDQLGQARAVTRVKYRIETPGHKEDLKGVEEDTLERRGGRWYIAAWERE